MRPIILTLFPESHITIQFENNKIHVRDTAPGITEEKLEKTYLMNFILLGKFQVMALV